MNPVKGYTMLNFLNWLTQNHPEIRSLRTLSEDILFDLINEFEGGKLMGNQTLRYKWSEGFRYLFRSNGDWQGYDAARRELTEFE